MNKNAQKYDEWKSDRFSFWLKEENDTNETGLDRNDDALAALRDLRHLVNVSLWSNYLISIPRDPLSLNRPFL